MYHFNIRGNNLLMYNTYEAGNMPFTEKYMVQEMWYWMVEIMR